MWFRPIAFLLRAIIYTPILKQELLRVDTTFFIVYLLEPGYFRYFPKLFFFSADFENALSHLDLLDEEFKI